MHGYTVKLKYLHMHVKCPTTQDKNPTPLPKSSASDTSNP